MKNLLVLLNLLIFVSLISCKNKESRLSETTKNKFVDVCSNRKFEVLFNIVDEEIDTSLVNVKYESLVFRLIYMVADKPSYIIKYFEKNDIGLLKIKKFPTSDLSIMSFCMGSAIEYDCKIIRLVETERLVGIRKQLSFLRPLFKTIGNEINPISLELVESGQHKYYITQENLDSIRVIIDSIIQNNR